MKVLLTVSVLAIALAAPAAATAAPPSFRPFAPPVVLQGAAGEPHAFWRPGDGDHDFGRHRHRHDFIGGFAPIVGEAAEPGPQSAPSPSPSPSPLVVAAPVFVNVTFAAGGGPAAMEPIPGPKIIEIGRSAPRRGHLPLVVYGE